MKLGKDEIQKIVLGLLMLFGVVYGYFSLLLGPLQTKQELTKKSAVALGPEIAAAKAQIAKSKEMEKNAPAATKTAQQVNAMIPEGSPVAWFPKRMNDFFKRDGIEKISTRLSTETTDKEMVGYRKMSWALDLPRVDFVPFAAAVADLENEEPLLEISSVALDASREDVETQHALINVNNIVKQ